MTQTADPAPIPATGPDRPREPRASAVAVCPYLLSDDGSWRSSAPAREHRCAAVLPATPLALEKQRRLCVTPAHRSCATFQAASTAHPGSDPDRPSSKVHRPYPRTAPVVIDHARLQVPAPAISAGRGTGQALLIGLLIVAFVAIALARLAGGGAADGSVVGADETEPPATRPAATALASPRVTSSPPSTPTTAPSPTATATPTAAASPSPSPVPATPAPTASTASRTYTVRSGDTLIGIASRFGTTAKALMELNGIDDARSLRIGTVLLIP